MVLSDRHHSITQAECNSNNKVDKKNFSLEYTEKNAFIFSTKYCINKLEARNVVDKRGFPDRKTVRHLVKRYKKTYNELQTHREKVEFVDLFLVKLTKKYHISLNENNTRKDTIQIIINSLNSNKSQISGHAVTLFQSDIISEERPGDFSQHLETNKPYSHSKAISDKVDFVLGGSSKKPIKLVGDYSTLWYGDPQDDDIIDEQERWEEEGDEYRDWAEDQADGWGDDWDFFWEDDEDEEWIVLFNEEGDVEEAYHFSPKAD
ncbi:hypothetical protein [Colwellia psychrerythraea]|uniref:Uncharacterized protein n=1 Tax=Colwellia psychrerythraea TaxID=28229 RepID=A0A099KDL3_COLPS|nr:hypothetical protein [Colwellia psychrerythraea]KGJ88420.1 hypothetical protein ND2E_4256 [Colwellia psychrerythraea]